MCLRWRSQIIMLVREWHSWMALTVINWRSRCCVSIITYMLTSSRVSCTRLFLVGYCRSLVRHNQNCPACSTSSSCDSCIRQPDCGWCYSTGTCTSVAKYDPKICPAEDKVYSGKQPWPLFIWPFVMTNETNGICVCPAHSRKRLIL